MFYAFSSIKSSRLKYNFDDAWHLKIKSAVDRNIFVPSMTFLFRILLKLSFKILLI